VAVVGAFIQNALYKDVEETLGQALSGSGSRSPDR